MKYIDIYDTQHTYIDRLLVGWFVATKMSRCLHLHNFLLRGARALNPSGKVSAGLHNFIGVG